MYLTTFATAFLAATILPFYSEFAVAAFSRVAGTHLVLLWFVASLGNTLGAVVNWALGRFLLHWQDRWWFPASRSHLERAQRWYEKYGVWSLLLAWLPFGGDPLTVIAGIMRVNFWLFCALVGFGKAARYAVVILLAAPGSA